MATNNTTNLASNIVATDLVNGKIGKYLWYSNTPFQVQWCSWTARGQCLFLGCKKKFPRHMIWSVDIILKAFKPPLSLSFIILGEFRSSSPVPYFLHYIRWVPVITPGSLFPDSSIYGVIIRRSVIGWLAFTSTLWSNHWCRDRR